MPHNKKQRGAALITAILITALAAMIATRLAWDTQHLINQRYLVVAHDKVNNALMAARNLEAAKLLLLAHNNKIHNYEINSIPKKMQSDTVNILGYSIKNTLIDAQSRFNINYISKQGKDAPSYINFASALTLDNQGLDPQTARTLSSEIADWSNPVKNEASDDYYTKKGLLYIPAHQPFIDTSSLIMLKGFTTSLVAALRPHLIALPTQDCANFNSVTDPFVLKACGLNDMQISAAASCRLQGPFTSADADKMKKCIDPSGGGNNVNLDVYSKYFLLTSCAKTPDSATTPCLQSLLYLNQAIGNHGLQISVLWQRGNATMIPRSIQEQV